MNRSTLIRLSLLCALVCFSGTAADAACILTGPRLVRATADAFLRDPRAIVRGYRPDARQDYQLSDTIAKFAVTGTDAIQAIKTLTTSTTPEQSVAIGKGLHYAVTFCRSIDSAVSARIASNMQNFSNKDVLLAYNLAESPNGQQPSTALRADPASSPTANADLTAIQAMSINSHSLEITDPSVPLELPDPFKEAD